MQIAVWIGLAAALVLAPVASAHTFVASSTPSGGSVLPASPPEIVITFRAETELTSVYVFGRDKIERKLPFAPKGKAKTFTIRDPKLGEGRNEVRWTALSGDDHNNEGMILITIRPGAEPFSPAPSGARHND